MTARAATSTATVPAPGRELPPSSMPGPPGGWSPWGSAVAIAAYAPLVLWAPLLTVVVADHRRRRLSRELSALR
ncbi:hypothetical protein E1212_21170 [Jiangella ureilytica]|uniref:Uncharacterized protein n=1 Tax=Jiangella ureilytica TaxID=2530374 RepID=A0A4R4RGL9_9ACTN|nr:hypothetical protein [Jiangella ureilytica]TDC48424.1 hypothetical protein E1212_21170 [Jiangella ureilytica]